MDIEEATDARVFEFGGVVAPEGLGLGPRAADDELDARAVGDL